MASKAKQIYQAVRRVLTEKPGIMVERRETQTGDRVLPDDHFETMVYYADGPVNLYPDPAVVRTPEGPRRRAITGPDRVPPVTAALNCSRNLPCRSPTPDGSRIWRISWTGSGSQPRCTSTRTRATSR